MKTAIKIWIFIFVINLTAGCAPFISDPSTAQAVIEEGMVESVYWGQVSNGLQAVIKDAPRTFIMTKENLTLMAWSVKQNGWAFVVFDNLGTYENPIDTWEQVTGGKGNLVNAKDLRALTNTLKDNGWKMVTAKAVAEGLKAGITTMAAWSTEVMPTFLILPWGYPTPLDILEPDIE